MTAMLTFDLRQVKQGVAWRDLTGMTAREGLFECLHLVPWLVSSWLIAAQGHWFWALPLSFMFFLTALRLNHEAIHHNLGLTAAGHRIVLHALSALMTGSNNAVAANHLHHHRHVMKPSDLEGKCGRMSWLRVLAYGPVFPIEMMRNAWTRGGPAVRTRMMIDATLNAIMLGIWLGTGWNWLAYHLIVVTIAQCCTAYFAVWITHHGCENEVLIARTQRSKLINFASYNMLFHLEHHMFPGVPVKRLHHLAMRLDQAVPGIAREAKRVVDWPIPLSKQTS
jgi:fatty acid desaturase